MYGFKVPKNGNLPDEAVNEYCQNSNSRTVSRSVGDYMRGHTCSVAGRLNSKSASIMVFDAG